MGTWDTGILEDDIAMDVKAEFDEAIAEGMSVKEATKQILKTFEDELEDYDEAPIVYLAIATLQIESGIVLKSIKEKVLEIIDSGQGLDRWKDAGEGELNKRINILNELKGKLTK